MLPCRRRPPTLTLLGMATTMASKLRDAMSLPGALPMRRGIRDSAIHRCLRRHWKTIAMDSAKDIRRCFATDLRDQATNPSETT
jgi:hypothetical protein